MKDSTSPELERQKFVSPKCLSPSASRALSASFLVAPDEPLASRYKRAMDHQPTDTRSGIMRSLGDVIFQSIPSGWPRSLRVFCSTRFGFLPS